MSERPWLDDPKYGGMSEIAARRSYEAWERQGKRVLQLGTALPASDAEIALIKRNIETQIVELRQAAKDFADWMATWRTRRPKGFRARRRQSQSHAEAAE